MSAAPRLLSETLCLRSAPKVDALLALRSANASVYVPPFDSPVVVEGHASLVHELKEDLQEHGVSDLAAVVCSVGGGGLISGILRGLEEVGLHGQPVSRCAALADRPTVADDAPQCVFLLPAPAPVLACETRGAASFALSLTHAHKTSPPSAALQKLDGITSIAATLGAVCVSQESLDRALAHEARGGIVSVVMEDERCVEAIRAFAGASLLPPAVDLASGCVVRTLAVDPLRSLQTTTRTSSSPPAPPRSRPCMPPRSSGPPSRQPPSSSRAPPRQSRRRRSSSSSAAATR